MPADRTPSGGSEAQRLQARAFTPDGGGGSPASAGGVASGPGRSPLAPELTPVAQRVRLDPNLPEEYIPAGRVLEAEALATEMVVGGPALPGRVGAPPSRAGVPSQPVAVQSLSAPGRSPSSGVGPTGTWADTTPGLQPGPALPLAAPAAGGPDLDALASSILDKMSGLSTPGAPTEPTVYTPQQAQVISASWLAPSPQPPPAVQRAPEPFVQTADPAPSSQVTPPPPDAGAEPSKRPTNEDLNNLSRWLYPLIRYQLKGELREDRERAGLLTDHYRRW